MAVPDHAGRLQVLMIDGVVGAHKRKRYLVVKILSLAAYRPVRLRQKGERLAATVTPLPATEDAPLGDFQRAFGPPLPAGGDASCAARRSPPEAAQSLHYPPQPAPAIRR
jgi:hypothetical protein